MEPLKVLSLVSSDVDVLVIHGNEGSYGSGEHTCDGRSCVRILSFQKEDLVTWFEDITEREKSEVQIVAECYARTTVNIATALGFFSRMCSLQSLERLESEHHLVTALSVESWPGVLQVTQKHIRSWKVGLEAEIGFPMSEAYGLPLNAKSLIGSVMANLCGSHYPLHMAMVEVSSQRILVEKAFSVPKCVRFCSDVASLAQIVEKNPRDSAKRNER